ncbi:MAG: MerR family transcriptional regulator [Mogibacterium sp.]|nr:MerR family transcriptional regulator [Mogibacterium sp.]
MTVHEVSKLTGVSIRTLQYYDKIGLLHPAEYSDAGYRLYNEKDLEKLQQILLFRELEFPLKDIREIIDSPDFDRDRALKQQIELLMLKREHINNLITLARGIQLTGGRGMDFTAFDTKKLDEYARQAKESWESTKEYKEFEAKNSNRTLSEMRSMGDQLMSMLAEFGKMKDKDPADSVVQAQVKKVQEYITENFYTCTKEILYSLGSMYAGGGEFTKNIDDAGGVGTAEYAAEAIKYYCKE